MRNQIIPTSNQQSASWFESVQISRRNGRIAKAGEPNIPSKISNLRQQIKIPRQKERSERAYDPITHLKIDKKITIKNYLKDHRVFMTSLIAALSFGGKWTIHDKNSINTSFPNFLKIINDLKK